MSVVAFFNAQSSLEGREGIFVNRWLSNERTLLCSESTTRCRSDNVDPVGNECDT